MGSELSRYPDAVLPAGATPAEREEAAGLVAGIAQALQERAKLDVSFAYVNEVARHSDEIAATQYERARERQAVAHKVAMAVENAKFAEYVAKRRDFEAQSAEALTRIVIAERQRHPDPPKPTVREVELEALRTELETLRQEVAAYRSLRVRT